MWTHCRSSENLLIKQRRACFVFRKDEMNFSDKTFMWPSYPGDIRDVDIDIYR